MTEDDDMKALLRRLTQAVERLAPAAPAPPDFRAADAFVWHADGLRLSPVEDVARIDIDLLQGIDLQKSILLENTRRFARSLPANNALLWGARGMGKSSLVKAVHGAIGAEAPGALALIEIHREDIGTLPSLLDVLRTTDRQVILFCDDLSFEKQDTSYKSLKAVLEGGIEGRPETVVFYATSNRRHLMPREMIENEQQRALIPGEAVEETVSLSDRFGLWLGFHPCNQEVFLAMIRGYLAYFGLEIPEEEWRPQAIEWSMTRGSRSGRVAWQFLQELAGRAGRHLDVPPPV